MPVLSSAHLLKSSCLRIVLNYRQQIQNVKGALCNCITLWIIHKVKSKKRKSKAIHRLHNLIFKSHGICVLIRKLQRKKQMTRKVSNQATVQEQAGQKAEIFLTFLPFTKKTSSSPASFGAILHTFQTSLKQGHRPPLWEQPYSPQPSEHQPHHK